MGWTVREKDGLQEKRMDCKREGMGSRKTFPSRRAQNTVGYRELFPKTKNFEILRFPTTAATLQLATTATSYHDVV